MPNDSEEKVSCPAYIRRSQKEKLDELSSRTRIPRNALMREAVDDLLTKYADRLEER